MGRVANTADARAIGKICRAELVKGLETDKFMQVDMDKLCSHYADFLCAVLEATPRPTAKLLQDAAKEAFSSATKSEAQKFGQQLASAVQYCRGKIKGTRNGKRLSPGVLQIVDKMRGASVHMDSKLVTSMKRKALQKMNSDASSPVAPRRREPAVPAQSQQTSSARSARCWRQCRRVPNAVHQLAAVMFCLWLRHRILKILLQLQLPGLTARHCA